MRVVAFLFLFVVGFVDDSLAMHENDHRYKLSGYVRDAAGVPKSDTTVLLQHLGAHPQKQKIQTDRAGYYEHVFHLHNDNEGDELTATVGAEVKKVVAVFDPEDKVAHRGSEINFGAPAQSGNGLWLYGVGGAVFVGLLFFLMKKKKKIFREEKKKKKKE